MSALAKDASGALLDPRKPVFSASEILDVRARFPGLSARVNGKPLIYLDSANTAQKIDAGIAAGNRYYQEYTANVFRAVHSLGEQATAAFEGARETIRALVNAREAAEIIFTRGTTEAINLVANSFGELLRAGDTILLTQMEHHANIVPWQMLAARRELTIKVVPLTANGLLDTAAAEQMLRELSAAGRLKLFAFTHVSNVLGCIHDAAALCAMARKFGVPSLVDGSQAVPHQAVDVTAMDCDFYAFTGHKLFGPTGTGVLYGKRIWLDAMPPWMGGGEMIESVSFSGSTYNAIPNKFEAGTPNIAGFIGLAAAIAAITDIGLSRISAREAELEQYAASVLPNIPGLRLLGREAGAILPSGATRTRFAPVFSFVIDGTHPHDLAMLLDQDGIAIRSGQHCAHPLMQALGVKASARASLAFYNTEAEIDALALALVRARKALS